MLSNIKRRYYDHDHNKGFNKNKYIHTYINKYCTHYYHVWIAKYLLSDSIK